MNYKTLTIAGWLTMLNAFASLPMAYLAFNLEDRVDSTGTLILATMQAAGTLLFVAIDGHAKNFSIALLPCGNYQLAPIYDVMSA